MHPTRLGLTAAALLALTLSAASPATAAPRNGATTTLRASSYDACLDSDRAGNAYINTCNGKNAHHRWQWTTLKNGFQIRNEATQRCLVDDGSRIATRTCDAASIHQLWFANAGQFGNFRLLNNGTSRYLAYDNKVGLTGSAEHGTFSWYTNAP
ncbi:RICIN domain-containing protein [Streptomyces lushanensis]|uniref:RICIN domain-containing protein n=1 Tax=Streptomyces lushanensis TaxID=1434255 RepID=UPI000833D750|nr:ricin-type beta-trefoil lectin domain protein [Streptomyces lushanensis]